MRNLILALIALGASSSAIAAVGEVPLEHVQTDIGNTASLQRGARLFVNYCMGCHGAQYMRYSRLAEDLDLTEEQVEQFLIFDPDKKIGDLMTTAMPGMQATEWFGAAPADLSLVARSRGPDWLYTFLKSFYADPTRPSGWNNRVFANTSMPHVLWPLQGVAVLEHAEGEDRATLAIVEPGEMTPEAYDAAVTDLVTFLEYVGEPAKLKRESLGVWVLLYLALFAFLAYLLKREYWRDVH